jgi:hypothetical protein
MIRFNKVIISSYTSNIIYSSNCAAQTILFFPANIYIYIHEEVLQFCTTIFASIEFSTLPVNAMHKYKGALYRCTTRSIITNIIAIIIIIIIIIYFWTFFFCYTAHCVPCIACWPEKNFFFTTLPINQHTISWQSI